MKKSIALFITLTLLNACTLKDFVPLESHSTHLTVQDPKTSYIKAVNCVASSFHSASNSPLFSYQSDTLYGFKSTFYFTQPGTMGFEWQYRADLSYTTLDNEVTIEISHVELCVEGPQNRCQSKDREGLEVNQKTQEMLDQLVQCMQ